MLDFGTLTVRLTGDPQPYRLTPLVLPGLASAVAAPEPEPEPRAVAAITVRVHNPFPSGGVLEETHREARSWWINDGRLCLDDEHGRTIVEYAAGAWLRAMDVFETSAK